MGICQEFNSIHFGHLDVREKEVETCPAKLFQRFPSVLHGSHVVPMLFELELQDSSQGSVIIGK
jgi:hypothetical protein